DYRSFSVRLDIDDIHFIPISALKGDNVVETSNKMTWFKSGPLLNYLETVHIASDRNLIDLRLPIQYVVRPDLNFRGFAGTMASGILHRGDEVVVLPGGQKSHVKKIVTFDGNLEEAFPPLSVTITLEDEIDVSRGDIIARPDNQPRVGRELEAMIVWMAEQPMTPMNRYLFKQTSNMISGTVSMLRYRINVDTIEREDSKELKMNEVGRCRVSLERSIPFDSYKKNRTTGAFIIIDRLTLNTVGAGMIIDREAEDEEGKDFWGIEVADEFLKHQRSRVSIKERVELYKQEPLTILLTGLPCTGKTTIAYALERRLFDNRLTVTVLDGADMRSGISKDLGFTAKERSENMRRAAEIALLLNNSGLICICSFVAPDDGVREKARKLIGSDRFIEIYLTASEDTRRKRDEQSAYNKADKGEINEFQGISAPYDVPESPDLILETDKLNVEECVDRIIRLLEKRR
ncbi:MAG: adenylyl-sulfate kinase, partial [Planctomycetes bacterium RIFCSPHIGHO2_12_39_6]